jgi:ferritin-like metal-binding protein YciE
VERLEKIAEMLEMNPTGKKCAGMQGVIKEGALGRRSRRAETANDRQ